MLSKANHRNAAAFGESALLSVKDLKKSYPLAGGRPQHVLKGVSFHVMPQETVGIVGASGAGKSTIGRIIANLEQADGGSIHYLNRDLARLHRKRRREAGQSISVVFQDPYEFLSPRMKVEQLVAEPLVIRKEHRDKEELRARTHQALADVSLDPGKYALRYPHELSGGERQRVGLARAFVSRPRLLIADEPTSMLDASLRLDLLACMTELQRKYGTAIIFITHDLALTYRFCNRLIVLDEGEIAEEGTPDRLIDHPRHPFTRSLIDALLEFHR